MRVKFPITKNFFLTKGTKKEFLPHAHFGISVRLEENTGRKA